MLWSVAASATVVAVVLLFVNVTTASRVAANAEELHWANATLGTAALSRTAAAQASLFSGLLEHGFASEEAAHLARNELEETTSALTELAASAQGPTAALLKDLVGELRAVPVDPDAVDVVYRQTAQLLGDRIDTLEARIADSDRLADRISGGIRLLVIVILPVTAILVYRRRTAEQLRAARVQLEAEQQISRSKDQFVAGMSHEIRTPLTAICGFAELLVESPGDREIAQIIHSEATELSRMVDDFIVASRIEGESLEVKPEPTDLLELVESLAERFRRRNLPITVEGEKVAALCDPGRTAQILTNLVSNAVRHGGPNVTATVRSNPSAVYCHVSDEGPAMPVEVADRLFTRFVYDGREALTTGSLGLGTWVARRLAQAMDGEISYHRRGQRTVFTLRLPTAPSALGAERPKVAAAI
ncbi:MAG TPA: HAMP domain-containing sensor histidine kinase [Acidimicrobiia bacterium]|nr:HAMP domain-containing sensor histidine kinase [Acidimicrobiia bacterium]